MDIVEKIQDNLLMVAVGIIVVVIIAVMIMGRKEEEFHYATQEQINAERERTCKKHGGHIKRNKKGVVVGCYDEKGKKKFRHNWD